ncbi:MAG: hypothetical protein HYW48_07500 [Deltaproteobacteria bacterium]|nr:hypothetical protein [Deltaproteobacteria bacterium]
MPADRRDGAGVSPAGAAPYLAPVEHARRSDALLAPLDGGKRRAPMASCRARER